MLNEPEHIILRLVNMTLRIKLILILSAVAICPMILIGTLGFFSAKATLESLRMEELQSLMNLKAAMIDDFFDEQKIHVRVAQQRPTIKRYASILSESPIEFSSSAYENIRDELDGALGMYLSVYGYTNVILVNPLGRIVYVLDRNSASEDLEKNLPEFWQQLFDKGKREVHLSDVFRSRSKAERFSVYIAAPVRNDNAGRALPLPLRMFSCQIHTHGNGRTAGTQNQRPCAGIQPVVRGEEGFQGQTTGDGVLSLSHKSSIAF